MTMTHRISFAPAALGLILCLTVAVLPDAPARCEAVTPAAQAPTDTLILVNDDPITVADLDAMVLKAHESGRLAQGGAGLVRRYLDKRVNDLLILQDALAAGMADEPEVVTFTQEKERQYAIQAYVKDHLELPEEAPADSVRAYFERYYWRIQVRQLSVRTREEAEALRETVLAGADMDSLAKAVSLDTKKLRGGLYNLLHWADVENVIRDQVRELKPGEISPVFPYREAYAFVRVEQRLPVDEDYFPKVRDKAAMAVLGILRQREWDAFIEDLMARNPVQESMDAMFAIAADSSLVLRGEFLVDADRPALFLDDDHVVTEAQLRKAVSREAMKDNSRPFSAIFAAARRDKKRELVLGKLAADAGYVQREDVQARVDADWEQLLIENYLNETVASKIRFNREELRDYYQEHLDRFRGPEEVRLEILILEDEDTAREAAARLAAGADFTRIFNEYRPGTDFTPGKSTFIPVDQLSQVFRDQLEHMEEGQSSEAVKMPMGWMVFQLAERRPGTPAPYAEVEMAIRKAVYQQKFDSLLDDLLGRLKAASRIVRYEDRIREYFDPSGGGRR